jgi:hypothetical protein
MLRNFPPLFRNLGEYPRNSRYSHLLVAQHPIRADPPRRSFQNRIVGRGNVGAGAPHLIRPRPTAAALPPVEDGRGRTALHIAAALVPALSDALFRWLSDAVEG